jgi:hypothetical protein
VSARHERRAQPAVVRGRRAHTPGAFGCTQPQQLRVDGERPAALHAPACVCRVSAGRTTAIKDQGACGSCVAFATTALAEWAHMTAFGTSNSTTDLSEQDLLECTGGNGCKGQHQELYIDMIACSGIAAEADEPYTARNDADRCKRHTRDSGIAATRGGARARDALLTDRRWRSPPGSCGHCSLSTPLAADRAARCRHPVSCCAVGCRRVDVCHARVRHDVQGPCTRACHDQHRCRRPGALQGRRGAVPCAGRRRQPRCHSGGLL